MKVIDGSIWPYIVLTIFPTSPYLQKFYTNSTLICRSKNLGCVYLQTSPRLLEEEQNEKTRNLHSTHFRPTDKRKLTSRNNFFSKFIENYLEDPYPTTNLCKLRKYFLNLEMKIHHCSIGIVSWENYEIILKPE